MPGELEPIIHNWYREVEHDQKFVVVAIDELNGIVELQQMDGSLEEVALEDWEGLELEAIEQPEDWTGPIDDFIEDDLGYTETGMTEADWYGRSEEVESGETASTVYQWEEDIDTLRGT